MFIRFLVLNNYVLNNAVAMGLAQALLANPNLTWETTYITNVGVDFGVLNNRLTGTVEYFHKKTKDILIELPAPLAHGTADIPRQNSATVTNQGLELSLGWQDRVGDFTYGINGNFTYVKNMVNKFRGDVPSISGANYICEGYSINSQYILQVDRIIQTEEDLAIVNEMLANNPDAFAAFGTPQMGDLLYKDTNGRDENGNLTGRPDGKIDANDWDYLSRKATPRINYGFGLNLEWKGFAIDALFQGVGGYDRMIKTKNGDGVFQGTPYFEIWTGDVWTPENTDAKYPAATGDWHEVYGAAGSTFWIRNGAYLRLKNLNISYTLPKTWYQNWGVNAVQIFGNGTNLFSIDGIDEMDPEQDSMDSYPIMRSFTIGLNINF